MREIVAEVEAEFIMIHYNALHSYTLLLMLCSIVVAVSGWFKVDAVLIRVHKELNIDTAVYG